VPAAEQDPPERHVALGDSLLEQVADDDEQDDVEGFEGAELATSHDARHDDDEHVRPECADDDVHRYRARLHWIRPRRP
jgi:hypothetical protein